MLKCGDNEMRRYRLEACTVVNIAGLMPVSCVLATTEIEAASSLAAVAEGIKMKQELRVSLVRVLEIVAVIVGE
jgi:hypothetical protein